VDAEIRRDSVRAITNKVPSVTPRNVNGVELLCTKFGFQRLDEVVRTFRRAHPCPGAEDEMLVVKSQMREQGMAKAIALIPALACAQTTTREKARNLTRHFVIWSALRGDMRRQSLRGSTMPGSGTKRLRGICMHKVMLLPRSSPPKPWRASPW